MGNRCFLSVLVVTVLLACARQAPPTPGPPPPATADEEVQAGDEPFTPPAARTAEALAALLPSDGDGCSPGARCIRVTETGQPRSDGTWIAQCRGELADFIVPRNTVPAVYAGPWFTPHLIESAHTGIPQGARPWRSFDPRQSADRLAYLLALRNYAFASGPVRSLTPQFTVDSDYFDSAGGAVPATQRTQKWYPAPRMIYGGNPDELGSGAREAAYGMTLERRVRVGELAGNTAAFRNYAVAYYDARGARTYARVWSTATAGVDTPRRAHMRVSADGFVYKLLFSAAKPSDFPQDILAGSLAFNILPNGNGVPVPVRLLQIDIAVKDNRAGPTGWYFATFAFDHTIAASSPWLKMVPVGLMWGNDPDGMPIEESWINASAPSYALNHLGVDGRLNGPVDNPVSACMSCHGTAQAPSVANMLPPAGGPCVPLLTNWFRNLPGTTPFGRFDDQDGVDCQTSLAGITLTAGDYSLQLADTVTRALDSTRPSFNPCTWDDAAPPAERLNREALRDPRRGPTIFKVTRDPERR